MFQSLTRDSNHSNTRSDGRWWLREMFQSLTRDSNHSNSPVSNAMAYCLSFQSLTRDSNHSNSRRGWDAQSGKPRFNPSRGIAIIQTRERWPDSASPSCFNPSRGIAIIQTPMFASLADASRRSFQSLTRDSNHSNPACTKQQRID